MSKTIILVLIISVIIPLNQILADNSEIISETKRLCRAFETSNKQELLSFFEFPITDMGLIDQFKYLTEGTEDEGIPGSKSDSSGLSKDLFEKYLLKFINPDIKNLFAGIDFSELERDRKFESEIISLYYPGCKLFIKASIQEQIIKFEMNLNYFPELDSDCDEFAIFLSFEMKNARLLFRKFILVG